MPINFSSLPEHIQVSLMQKLDAGDFASFLQSSQQPNTAAKYIKNAISFPKDLTRKVAFDFFNMGVKLGFGFTSVFAATFFGKCIKLDFLSGFRFDAVLMIICGELNDEFCRSLIHFFHKSGSSAITISFDQEAHISCSPELFTVLLEEVGAKSIKAKRRRISSTYLRKLPKQIEQLSAITEITDAEFISLKYPHIELADTEISGLGINEVIKEWYERKRKIVCLSVRTKKKIVKDQILSGMLLHSEGLNTFKIDNGSEVLTVTISSIFHYVRAEVLEKMFTNKWV